MRLVALVALSALVLAACGSPAAQRAPGPASVPHTFTLAVDELLDKVSSREKPVYQAETCGPSSSGRIYAWTEIAATGVDAHRIRTQGAELGWQLQDARGFEVFLLGPDDIRFAMRGDRIRAEFAECPNGDRQQLAGQFTPILTIQQTNSMGPAFTATAAAAQSLFASADPPLDFMVFPPTGDFFDAVHLPLVNCGREAAGAQWSTESRAHLRNGLESSAVARLLTDDWLINGPKGALEATHRYGAKVKVTVGEEAVLTTKGPCLDPRGQQK
ncbi:hypothetical protein V5P93_007173 [Actinokineospora auranticolor]|uniref:Lipoprotein n=1 Tax=Actinokineospora auranticolor TaxID=155976 RepID=A0A2S6GRT0_9PSEU|nr:hypothetical protein [Actinokineospora auranticolor]PPK67831.1 hypothetical protein CLV40_10661 [Actinokineospora auranticolor]